jgi:hypothetical protein
LLQRQQLLGYPFDTRLQLLGVRSGQLGVTFAPDGIESLGFFEPG